MLISKIAPKCWSERLVTQNLCFLGICHSKATKIETLPDFDQILCTGVFQHADSKNRNHLLVKSFFGGNSGVLGVPSPSPKISKTQILEMKDT